MYKTIGGKTVTLTAIDTEAGYIYGYIEGVSEPVTWGWPDGECLTFSGQRGGHGYNLNMEGFKCQP